MDDQRRRTVAVDIRISGHAANGTDSHFFAGATDRNGEESYDAEVARAASDSIELGSVLSSLAGRKVSIGEIIAALEMGRSTYYEQRDDGRLLCADNLLRLAAELDLNPVELLMHCGLVEPPAVIDCAVKVGDTTNSATPRSRRFQRRPDAPPL